MGESYSFRDGRELQRARALYASGDYAGSLRAFEEVARLMPNNILALADAARAFGQRYEVKKALQWIKRMLFLGKGDPRVLMLAGQSYRMIHRKAEAMECLENAAELAGGAGDVYLELGVLYEQSGELEKSLHALECYLHGGRGSAEAALLRGQVLLRMGEFESSEKIFRKLMREEQGPFMRAQAASALAKQLDERGEYAEAFQVLQEGKNHWKGVDGWGGARERASEERDCMQKFMRTLEETDWSYSERVESEPQTVMLTGCPRSGTTLIEKVLDAHSGVISADELLVFPNLIFPSLLGRVRDETGYFGISDMVALSSSQKRRAVKQYRRAMEEGMGQKVGKRTMIDKNPSLTGMLPVLFELCPNQKVLYALRDPRDVVLSCYFQWLPLNSVSVQFSSLEATARWVAEELERWIFVRERLAPELWMETRYESTVEDYRAESARIFNWLGVDGSEVDYREHAQERGFNSPSYAAVQQAIYQKSLDRWKCYKEALGPVMGILEPSMDQLGYR
ncbi:tetratricopeptide repeat-containing sulfotransferase family protein [Rubritalea tangerina]|uniref:Tetratricopeptide repeat-containing sulfotransferase family protein n=2 Tax=Rubritalea tangerina TaxID=430798 RepID=A0ABW4ZFA4_9BACT